MTVLSPISIGLAYSALNSAVPVEPAPLERPRPCWRRCRLPQRRRRSPRGRLHHRHDLRRFSRAELMAVDRCGPAAAHRLGCRASPARAGHPALREGVVLWLRHRRSRHRPVVLLRRPLRCQSPGPQRPLTPRCTSTPVRLNTRVTCWRAFPQTCLVTTTWCLRGSSGHPAAERTNQRKPLGLAPDPVRNREAPRPVRRLAFRRQAEGPALDRHEGNPRNALEERHHRVRRLHR